VSVHELLPREPFRADRYVLETQRERAKDYGEVPFDRVIEAFQQYLGEEVGGKDDVDSQYLHRKYRALIGDETAKQYFIHRIHDFLRAY